MQPSSSVAPDDSPSVAPDDGGESSMSCSVSMPNLSREPRRRDLAHLPRSNTGTFQEPLLSGPPRRSPSFLSLLASADDTRPYSRLAGLGDVTEDEDEPEDEKLLQKAPGQETLASNRKTFFNLLKAFLGSGVLFVPRALHNAGLVAGLVTIIVVALISLWCMILMVEIKKIVDRGRGESNLMSYGEIGRKSLGMPGLVLVDLSIALSQMGFSCAYFVFIATNIRDIVLVTTNCDAKSVWALQDTYLILMMIPIATPLAWVRRLRYLSLSNIVADLLILGSLLYVAAMALVRIQNHGIERDSLTVVSTPVNYLLFLGTSVYLFEGIALVVPIYDTMEQKEKMPPLLCFSMFVITMVFLCFGVVNYVAYGSDIQSIITLNLGRGAPGTYTIQICYSLALLLSYPLVLFPAIRISETVVFRFLNIRGKWKKNIFRCTVVVFTAAVSIVGQGSLDSFISLIGSVCCVPLAFIYPPLFHLVNLRKTTPLWKNAINVLLIPSGLLMMVVSTGLTAYSWIAGRQEVAPSRC